jgi:flagellar biosynthesis protein FlhF
LHRGVFGGSRTGLLTLDTFRVGAVEQIQQYAEISNVPVEVAYDAHDVQGALKRLEGCDVVIIDTPGRSPRAAEANAQWQATLRAIRPDEVQLVVPATMRPDGIPALLAAMAPCKPTHACITKFDELHDDRAVADVAARIDLPIRWMTDGQSVPADLHAARSRVLGALGVPVQTPRGAAA